MKRVAIFDVDGTIFRSSLLIELVEALIEAKIFPINCRRGYQKELESWLNREGSYEDYISAVINIFTKNIKGVYYGDFIEIGKILIKQKQKRVYRFTRDLIAQLKKKEYFLLAISQSPKGILDNFCAKLGFDKVYGRFYELGPDDKFTGQVTDEHLISNKANIVKRAIEKENLTLKGSIAVGDTEDDIPMLEIAEKVICFNPNQKLLRYAKINNWPIVVERKDVIYEID
ncbi:MAG: HAD-IB family hydrolase [Candidatus Paceibacterota bacterium]|jgi:HAD superfamily hydrolase (TIGR01490 family)